MWFYVRLIRTSFQVAKSIMQTNTDYEAACLKDGGVHLRGPPHVHRLMSLLAALQTEESISQDQESKTLPKTLGEQMGQCSTREDIDQNDCRLLTLSQWFMLEFSWLTMVLFGWEARELITKSLQQTDAHLTVGTAPAGATECKYLEGLELKWAPVLLLSPLRLLKRDYCRFKWENGWQSSSRPPVSRCLLTVLGLRELSSAAGT